MRFLYKTIFFLAIVSCSTNKKELSIDRLTYGDSIVEQEDISYLKDTIDARMNKIGLFSIHDFDTNILVDLKYSSTNNFMGVQLYDTLHSAYLQKDVLDRLVLCQKFLDSLMRGYRLLVFDGVRPLQVQVEMWNALDSVPVALRGRFVSNPALGSVHNFGAAVDLTIVNRSGEALDMGAGYDDFRDIAFPSKEAHFLETGELSKVQYANRRLLRKVMASQRFSNIPSEWWHFNACSRNIAERNYPILISESGKTEVSHRSFNSMKRRDSILVDTLKD